MLRYIETNKFMERVLDKSNAQILDLGVQNPLSDYLQLQGWNIENTGGEDLDTHACCFLNILYDFNTITAFEIFEHLLAPYNFLSINKGELVCSVPLKVWFNSAYWNNKEPWDCHYHEFEKRQFDMLLQRTGWKIITSKTLRKPDKIRGIRSFLRFIFPSYYFVYAIKN